MFTSRPQTRSKAAALGEEGALMKLLSKLILILFLPTPLLLAQSHFTASDDLPARIVQREHEVAKNLERFHPIVETYVQVLEPQNGELALSYDRHFISLAEFSGGLHALRFKSRHMELWREISDYSDSLKPAGFQYNPSGFIAMAYPDPGTFDLQHYHFQFVTQEFIGEVPCLVFQVTPTALRKRGLFEGKIWVEKQNFTIVRFNGIYRGSNFYSKYLHFDSWRVEAKHGQWFPAAIYSQEMNLPCCGVWKVNWTKVRMKAQTRFWGYDLQSSEANQTFTRIVVDPAYRVNDSTDSTSVLGPVWQGQMWEQQAEDNVSTQLERIGLLAPVGDVETVLETVVNNIEITNNLSIEPAVRCRVLLTSNLESAVVGHTIILSRGLIDVLPDEATLAAVLAHDLALVTMSDPSFTKFSWADQIQFGPRDVIRKLRFVPSAKQEERASILASEWLSNSPYKDSLDSVARFVAELHSQSAHIDRLLHANIGESLYKTLGVGNSRAESLQAKAERRVNGLPLGSRIAIDPLSCRLTLLKPDVTEASSFSANKAFAVTPFFFYLRHASDNVGQQSAEALIKPSPNF
jgi:hypothetical protein